jgi:hypothetical protein
VKNDLDMLMGIAMNLQISVGDMAIVRILALSLHEEFLSFFNILKVFF